MLVTAHRPALLVASALATLALCVLAPNSALAKPAGGFGLGIVLGEPTGLTAKGFFAQEHALQAHLGFAFGKNSRIHVVVDYLYHFHNVIPPLGTAGFLAPYLGVGGLVSLRTNAPKKDEKDVSLGVLIPLGLSFVIRTIPIEIFLEVAPGIGILPGTFAIIDGGLGARYYF
jgi:hypothetical protein